MGQTMDRLLLSLFILIFMTACSQRKGVPVNISIKHVRGLAGLNAEFAGGVVIFGKNASGDSFSRAFDGAAGTADFSLTLNNGIWDIYAIGWEGDSGNLTGKVRCGISNVSLTGVNASVNLSLTNASCNSPQFSSLLNYSVDYSFPSLKFNTCKVLVNSGMITATQENDVCEYPTGQYPATGMNAHVKGHLGSFKVLYRSEDNNNPTGDELESNCFSTFDSNAYMANEATISGEAINIPINGSLPMKVVVRGYYGSTVCDDYDSKGYKDFVFGGSLVNSHPDVFTYQYGAGPYQASMYLRTTDAEACSGPRNGISDYATGDGTPEFPHTICNKDQFNLIADDSIELSKNFRLGSDIDFGFDTSNFIAIGGGSAVPTAVAFKGNFFGNGHKLSNVRISCNNCDYAGIIRKISPLTSQTSVVNNLILENLNIESEYSTGATVGGFIGLADKGSGSAIKISNIVARKPRVFATGNAPKTAGGLFGKLIQADVTESHVVDGFLESNTAGGIAGVVDSLGGSINLSKVSFMGDIWTWDSTPGGAGGGIVGASQGSGSVMISEVRTQGRIKGNGFQGGILGENAATILNLSNSYSIARVLGTFCQSCTTYVGGLIGSSSSVASVNNSFKTLGAVMQIDSGSANGIYGSGSSMPNCTNTYHTGPATHGCSSGGGLKTVAQIQTNTQLTGISIGTTPAGIWMKPSGDDTYDYPRLSWEESRVGEIPELARNCSGAWSLPGAGTQASPYIISNGSQLSALAANSYYKLCRDIDFDGAVQSAPLTYPAVTQLDGNNYGIHNFKLSPITGATCNTYGANIGLFNTITSGSVVKNLSLYEFQYILTNTDLNIYAAATPCASGYKYGTIAAINNGTIQDSLVDNYKFKFSPLFNSTYSGNTFEYGGGIVADNLGTISGVDTYGRLEFQPSVTGNLTGTNIFNFGGAVGKGYSGSLTEKIYSDFDFSLNRMVAAEEAYDTMNIAGAVSSLLGTLSETSASSRVQHYNSVTPNVAMSTSYFGGLVAKLDGGTIQDSNASMTMNAMTASYFFTNMSFGGLVGYSNGGTIQRSYFAPDRHSDMSQNFDKPNTSINAKALIASAHASNTTTVSNVFCMENYETNSSTDLSANVGLTFADDTNGEPEFQAYPVSGTAITVTNAPNTCLVQDKLAPILPTFTVSNGILTLADDVNLQSILMGSSAISSQNINLGSITTDWTLTNYKWIFEEDVGPGQSNSPPRLFTEFYSD